MQSMMVRLSFHTFNISPNTFQTKRFIPFMCIVTSACMKSCIFKITQKVFSLTENHTCSKFVLKMSRTGTRGLPLVTCAVDRVSRLPYIQKPAVDLAHRQPYGPGR